MERITLRQSDTASHNHMWLVAILWLLPILWIPREQPQVEAQKETQQKTAEVIVTPAEKQGKKGSPSSESQQETKEEGNSNIPEFAVKFNSYYGGRYSHEYLQELANNCDSDTLQIVLAISVAETGMGKATNKRTNFYGWYKNGNTGYDPDMKTMAKEICTGISKYYKNVGNNMAVANIYTGNDRTSTWFKNFQWAYYKMETMK